MTTVQCEICTCVCTYICTYVDITQHKLRVGGMLKRARVNSLCDLIDSCIGLCTYEYISLFEEQFEVFCH